MNVRTHMNCRGGAGTAKSGIRDFIMNSRIFFLCLSGLLSLCHITPVVASDAPELTFQPAKQMLAGKIADGTLIGWGRLHSLTPGGSFKVWCGTAPADASVSICRFQGRNDGHHVLQVRLEKDAGTPGSQNGKSILLSGETGDNAFSIVAAGNQNIGADSYPVVLGAQLLSQAAIKTGSR